MFTFFYIYLGGAVLVLNFVAIFILFSSKEEEERWILGDSNPGE